MKRDRQKLEEEARCINYTVSSVSVFLQAKKMINSTQLTTYTPPSRFSLAGDVATDAGRAAFWKPVCVSSVPVPVLVGYRSLPVLVCLFSTSTGTYM
jgi:hypothetical protein